jgi:hypothetical protein
VKRCEPRSRSVFEVSFFSVAVALALVITGVTPAKASQPGGVNSRLTVEENHVEIIRDAASGRLVKVVGTLKTLVTDTSVEGTDLAA